MPDEVHSVQAEGTIRYKRFDRSLRKLSLLDEPKKWRDELLIERLVLLIILVRCYFPCEQGLIRVALSERRRVLGCVLMLTGAHWKRSQRGTCNGDAATVLTLGPLIWPWVALVRSYWIFLMEPPYFLLHILVDYLDSFSKHYNKIFFH